MKQIATLAGAAAMASVLLSATMAQSQTTAPSATAPGNRPGRIGTTPGMVGTVPGVGASTGVTGTRHLNSPGPGGDSKMMDSSMDKQPERGVYGTGSGTGTGGR